ncbi:MAG: 30S ribosome-binding factor RbfA [Candidatus Omnitrophica bacterium]|nr:30S ribosome-binding factor RbfA [Candidatus Omnitrophota bacterium]
MASPRLNRVAEAIKEEVARILQHELKDPRVGFVTVTRVEVTADLEHAVVYFSLLEGHGTAAGTEAGLKSAAGFIRKLVGERLRIRVTPEISFRLDPSVAESVRISKLLSDIRKQENPE